MDFYTYTALALALCCASYLLFDVYFLAPREAMAALEALPDFHISWIMPAVNHVIAIDFEKQHIAIAKRNMIRVFDISEVRDVTTHWTNVSNNRSTWQKDFHVIFRVADIGDPEIKVYLYRKKDMASLIEVVNQMIERRAVVKDQEAMTSTPNMSPANSVSRAIILTAVEAETRSVLAHFGKIDECVVEGTIFHVGNFQGRKGSWSVAVAEIGPRNANAGIIAERAIQYFKPNVAFFVGIAGGVKDVKLGDVVAATKIYCYESGKDTSLDFVPRPELRLTSYALEQRARSVRLQKKWYSRLKTIHQETPSAFVAPIAAGEVLIGSTKSSTAQRISSYYSDALAAEMEGYGFLAALHLNPHTHGMVVRGVSDLFDEKSKTDADGWQAIASNSAAAFTFEMLSEVAPSNDSIT